jgi:hypothetical protein
VEGWAQPWFVQALTGGHRSINNQNFDVACSPSFMIQILHFLHSSDAELNTGKTIET